jgi:hypothetical protein
MNDDYLWDRSGPPDPEIARLEQTLAALRYRPRPGAVAEARKPRVLWAAAAAAVLAAIATWQVGLRPPAATSWQVAGLEGNVRIAGRSAQVSMALRRGQLLRTGPESEITLQAEQFGQIDLGANSELRAATDQHVLLDRGQLHAFIWSRPGVFEVATPSARAIDLGCEYTINVDESGDGLLRVSRGWVAFQHKGHESFIPEGAACVTRKREGPGIPYYQDTSEPLRQALSAYEAGDRTALDRILIAATPHDGLTLWHLLTRVAAGDRPRVYDRFAALIEVPSDVSRDGVLKLDAHMIDRCWDALVLENTEWWRGWERKW